MKRYSLKIILFKVILFITIIVLLQILIVQLFQEKLHQQKVLDSFLPSKRVLFWGDSTVWYIPKNDKDRRKINETLQQLLPRVSIGTIAHAAYQMDIYASFCRYIARVKNEKTRVKVIIIPINMRSFAAEWDQMPRYQFIKERVLLEGGFLAIFFHPLNVIKFPFYRLNREKYNNIPIFKGKEQIGTIATCSDLKKSWILRYMYTLTREHRKMKSLVEIAELLPTLGIRPLFYLTPIDYQGGEKSHPGEFKTYLSANINLVKTVLAEKGYKVLDLSYDLGSQYFAWQDRTKPNEHLNQEGRAYVAKKLAPALKSLLTRRKHLAPRK